MCMGVRSALFSCLFFFFAVVVDVSQLLRSYKDRQLPKRFLAPVERATKKKMVVFVIRADTLFSSLSLLQSEFRRGRSFLFFFLFSASSLSHACTYVCSPKKT